MIKPLGDRVVLEAEEKEEKQPAASFCRTPPKRKTARRTHCCGWAARLDDNGNRIALEVKEGDHVIFSKYAGTEVKYGDKEYLILRESDILAIVD